MFKSSFQLDDQGHNGENGDSFKKNWFKKLHEAPWEYRTAYKTPIEATPFRLVNRKPCHQPTELEHRAFGAIKSLNFYLKALAKDNCYN